MKLNTRSVVVGALALASIIAAAAVVIWPANIPSASAQVPGSCWQIGVSFARVQLPVGMYPTFTITGPGGITIPSSRFFPGNGQESQSVNTTSAGASLPAGNYRIDVEPMAGTSSHNSINTHTGHSATTNCLPDTLIFFSLSYEAAPPTTDGSVLRINPAPQTVQAGHAVFFGVEHSTDNGQNWSDVSNYARSYSPQDVAVAGQSGTGLVRHESGGHLSNHEITGVRPGVAQIIALYNGFTASVNLTVTAGVPHLPGGGYGSCHIRSNPNIATGGSVKLLYDVSNLANIVSIVADDSAATPPGVPTLGAPDPGRADSQQDGSIDSGPVTKRTVFTMTVANSVTTRIPVTCSVTVPFNARPEASLRLPLVATMLDFPGGMFYGGGSGVQNLQSAAYSNGTFAFSGACGGSKNYVNQYSPFRQGGAWFFKDDGTEIAQRDLCMDGGSRFQALFFHGHAQSQMVADGDRGFFMAVKSMGSSGSHFYGSGDPGIVGAGANRAGYYQIAGNSVLFSRSSRVVDTGMGFAAANGKVIGNIDLETPGRDSVKNVTLSLPSLQILAEREESSIRPLIGFGDYILGSAGRSTDRCVTPISVNGMPTVFRIESDGGLTSVQTLTLPDNLCPGGMAIDYTTSPKRLAVTSFTISGSSRQFTNRIFLFTSGANGLDPVGEVQLPATILSDINRQGNVTAFAIGGSYLAFRGSVANGTLFTLWRDNELVGVAEPPVSRFSTPNGTILSGNVSHLYITPQGKVMATTGNSNNYGAYLFGGTPGSSTSTLPVPPNPFPTSTPTQIPGQSLTINTSSTPATILIRMANILSVSPTSLSISIFGHTYTVDASHANIYSMRWTTIPLSSFSPGFYVNVWGTLDLADPTLIHATNIRNPLPPGAQTGSTAATFTAPAQTPAQTAATQLKLNALQAALRALQLRLGQ